MNCAECNTKLAEHNLAFCPGCGVKTGVVGSVSTATYGGSQYSAQALPSVGLFPQAREPARAYSYYGAPGSGLLLVTGILSIVLGSIASISSLFYVLTVNMWAGMLDTSPWLVAFTHLTLLALSVYMVFVGIAGIICRNDMHRARFLLVLVQIYLAAFFIRMFVSILLGTLPLDVLSGLTLVLRVAGLVPVILFIVGAIKNKNGVVFTYSSVRSNVVRVRICESCNNEYSEEMKSCPHCAHRSVRYLYKHIMNKEQVFWECSKCRKRNTKPVCMDCGAGRYGG